MQQSYQPDIDLLSINSLGYHTIKECASLQRFKDIHKSEAQQIKLFGIMFAFMA